MNETSIDPPVLISATTNLPAIGLSLVVILCGYVAMLAYKEATAVNKLRDSLYEETGIDGKYDYRIPVEEKVCYDTRTFTYIS